MAVVNTKSNQVTNSDAVPAVLNSDFTARGLISESVGNVVAGASDSATSTYRYFRISSGARVGSIQCVNDANTGGTSYKVGVLETAANGGGLASGVAGSDAIFGSTISMATARANWAEILAFASGNAEKRIWEILGLSSDPFKSYDLVVSAVIPGSAGGNMALKLQAVV